MSCAGHWGNVGRRPRADAALHDMPSANIEQLSADPRVTIRRGVPPIRLAVPSPMASERISNRIAELGDWRGETLRRMRKLTKEADPDVVEEWKWSG